MVAFMKTLVLVLTLLTCGVVGGAIGLFFGSILEPSFLSFLLIVVSGGVAGFLIGYLGAKIIEAIDK